MKNITLTAEESLIEEARGIAKSRQTTLNEEFRRWLSEYTGRVDRVAKYRDLMERLSHVDAGRHFTRDEMHER